MATVLSMVASSCIPADSTPVEVIKLREWAARLVIAFEAVSRVGAYRGREGRPPRPVTGPPALRRAGRAVIVTSSILGHCLNPERRSGRLQPRSR